MLTIINCIVILLNGGKEGLNKTDTFNAFFRDLGQVFFLVKTISTDNSSLPICFNEIFLENICIDGNYVIICIYCTTIVQ